VFSIRERQQLKIIASREKRRIEKPRMPRTAKKITEKEMKTTMSEVNLDVDMSAEVSEGSLLKFFSCPSFTLKSQFYVCKTFRCSF